ncbi:zinc metallopeptidase [Haloimpatiens sp. FM7315]|uniref:zinc metallopeptidase n=1 Tax=Haloimpatiens sp. FM7315 TaxID=3298609 RepID=UPI0035A3B616
MFWYDNTIMLIIPAMIISFWAQTKVNSTFSKYSRVNSINGYTGAKVARMLLDSNGLYDIPVEITGGKLSDHYDPRNRVMRLSNDVYYGSSVAAIGVAAHETGHAIQHRLRYFPLILRNSIVPAANIGSNASWILFVAGMIFKLKPLINFGIIMFSIVVLFHVITLPVEFDASNRALKIIEDRGILYGDENKGAKKVLKAAAMTYVAATLMAVSQLIRLLILSRNED